MDCFYKNKFNGLATGEKFLNQSDCLSVNKQCCFVNLTHRYGNIQINSYFCAALTKKTEDFLRHFNNLYQDFQYQYANFTGVSYDLFRQYGRNLQGTTKDMFNCYLGPNSYTNYST